MHARCADGTAAFGLSAAASPSRPTSINWCSGSSNPSGARAPRWATDNGLPGFVWREFERYLDCGILARGFARVRCPRCLDELLVGFSCKGRGLCPSCGARRKDDTAAHLVDRVLPRVPYRQ
jgi:hypothetical protein